MVRRGDVGFSTQSQAAMFGFNLPRPPLPPVVGLLNQSLSVVPRQYAEDKQEASQKQSLDQG